MKLYRLAACLKCRGDLVNDEGDWLCLQCGVYYYTGISPEFIRHTKHRGNLRVTKIDPDNKDWGDGQLAPAAD